VRRLVRFVAEMVRDSWPGVRLIEQQLLEGLLPQLFHGEAWRRDPDLAALRRYLEPEEGRGSADDLDRRASSRAGSPNTSRGPTERLEARLWRDLFGQVVWPSGRRGRDWRRQPYLRRSAHAATISGLEYLPAPRLRRRGSLTCETAAALPAGPRASSARDGWRW
jgi:hypothetical protein